MSDSNKRKATKEEIKEYLITVSKDITEINKVLIEDIESGNNIDVCIYNLIRLGFSLDRFTTRKHLDISDQFSKHISELLKKM